MPYYAYMAGNCEQCGKELGMIETEGGRQREYCSDRCKQAAYRDRKKAEYRNKCLLRNTELRDYWQDNGVSGQVLIMLQDILVEHGKASARAATDAVLVALKHAQKEQEQLARLRAFGL